MNCLDFQDELPNIIETGGGPQEKEHLNSCIPCSELVRDLKYIADQAKLLLPLRDPSPRVWTNIESSLRREGLIPEDRMSLPGQKTITSTTTPEKKNWTPLGLALAVAAVAALAVFLFNYHSAPAQEAVNAAATSTTGVPVQDDDEKLMSQMALEAASVRDAYRTSLKEVNSYIVDAQKAVQDDPNDSDAYEHLADAYQQKAMLYEMATTRALQ